MYATPYPISWIIFILDSEPSSTDKLLKSRWVQIVPKIYDKRDDFDFDIVTLSFLDGDVPRRASYGVYMSQLIRFHRVCNHVADFNARNKGLTNLSNRAIGIINFEKHVLNFIADTINRFPNFVMG